MSALGQPDAQKNSSLVILNISKRLWQRVQQKPQTPSSLNIFQQNLKAGSGNKKLNPLFLKVLRFNKRKVVRYQYSSLPIILNLIKYVPSITHYWYQIPFSGFLVINVLLAHYSSTTGGQLSLTLSISAC